MNKPVSLFFFELLSKVEQFEQKDLLQYTEKTAVSEENKTRSYTKMKDDFKNDCYFIANYLSLYGHEDLFPNYSQDKSFEVISRKLNIKKNTIKNWRDMYDGHNDSSRKGWYQVELPSNMQEIKIRCELLSKEEFLAEVKQILNID